MTTKADDTDTDSEYDVVVIGGGPAGLTSALYTTRLGHDTAVFDRGGGRAAMMQDTHNVLGIPESVSGNELLESAIDQLEGYGAEYRQAFVTAVEHAAEVSRKFRLETTAGTAFTDRVVLATGLTDGRPEPPLPRTGRGLHYCLHCDAYMFVDESVYVMGHGESAAHVAMIMLNFTDDVDLLLRDAEPEWSDETDRQLRAHPVDIVEAEVVGVNNDSDGWLESLEFADGSRREYTGGFAMYGADYNNELAESLGVELDTDGAVLVDDHGRTNVEGVHAVGDITPGHNQIPVAMGQGARAGLAIHKDLRTYPKSLSELEGEIDSADVPALSDALRSHANERARADD
ncbi:NAD(P)/FAD-dependent oxidoreductase [Halorussus sp. MSC15.2]|uniref:NAD(P)/FAD-dependent oxidoreductase n=1 Tax=Halorussus sp. MSC15.2 TaxID=2283638 RepID=UPI0013D52D62|nr:NAD(P)/FAD-dependent oxidoreductase [Halorussus sp. MSC15.2]NEU58624.1 NAD(P)/FAD-dependent oxidoreductase [Halorussus sp. MSC15.2]